MEGYIGSYRSYVRDHRGVILGSSIRIMEKKMETTLL